MRGTHRMVTMQGEVALLVEKGLHNHENTG